MINTPILKDRRFYFVDDINGNWYLCSCTLHEVFDFPKKVKQIQFQAWPEPGRGRIKIKIKKSFKNLDYWHIEIDGENQCVIDNTVRAIMGLTKKRRTWYIKLYYWI